jgi:hypothetical protein
MRACAPLDTPPELDVGIAGHSVHIGWRSVVSACLAPYPGVAAIRVVAALVTEPPQPIL